MSSDAPFARLMSDDNVEHVKSMFSELESELRNYMIGNILPKLEGIGPAGLVMPALMLLIADLMDQASALEAERGITDGMHSIAAMCCGRSAIANYYQYKMDHPEVTT